MPVTEDKRDAGHLQGGDSPEPNTPLLLRPQTAQHGVFLLLCGVLLAILGNRPQIAAQRPAGSTGSTAGTPGIVASALAQPDKPLSVAAAHHNGNAGFCLVRPGFAGSVGTTFLGEMRSTPTGSIRSDRSVGVPINSGFGHASVRREDRRCGRPAAPAVSGCPTPAPHTFSPLRSSVGSRYSMSRPIQESFAPAAAPPFLHQREAGIHRTADGGGAGDAIEHIVSCFLPQMMDQQDSDAVGIRDPL